MILVAYVDPGLGLLAWQAVVAAFLGLFFYIRKTRSWVTGLFLKLFRLNRPPPQPLTPPPPSPSDARR